MSEFCQSYDANLIRRLEGRAPARPKTGRSAVRHERKTCQSSVRVVMQNWCVVGRVGFLPDLPIPRFDEKFGSAGTSPSQLKNLSEFCQSCDAKFQHRLEGHVLARPKIGRSAVRRERKTCQSSVRVVMQNFSIVWRVGLLPDRKSVGVP